MSNTKKIRVAVCGGGIGGLTAAVALGQYPNIEVEVYEAATKFGELGAGIGIFPRPWQIMKKLGLDQDLLKSTEIKPKEGPVTSFRYRKSDRPEGLDFYTLITQGNLLTFHRPDFQQVLLRRLPKSCRTCCSKRLRSYIQRPSGPIEVTFEDGSRTTCDVLIGADGLKSAVRQALLGEKAQYAGSQQKFQEAADITSCIDPAWSGTNAYRALIPAHRLREKSPNHPIFTRPTQYLGKNGYIIAYPISHGKMINFVAFLSRHNLENTKFNGPWVSTVEKSDFVHLFANWEPEVQELMACVERPLKWAIHTVRPLPSFVSGGVALVGDAGHATVPHQGSGAGHAIEDAYFLATLLGHPATTRETLHRALRIYDQVRRPYALRMQEKSRLNGRYFTMNVDGLNFDTLSGDRLREKLHQLGETFTKNWEWAWTTTIDSSLQQAIQLLESS
ncbi:salicylate hydroxylase [Infundibulicybe gibba]|nr:salicylate hydroxylase [Infundibulicybe gibba]